MSSSTQASNNGLTFSTVLFLVFLVLKLTGVIAWSWWWVTAPLWIPFVILGVVGLFALAFIGIAAARTKARRKARR